MDELSFRGKDRYHLSWPHVLAVGGGAAVEGVVAFSKLGATGFCWVLGGTGALVGVILCLVLRSWTRVGAGGVALCWGLGRGRAYSWQEVRWIDVRETRSQYGNVRVARLTLANGRRRSLPALQDSSSHPNPGFDTDYARILRWWRSATEPAARFEPQRRLRSRVTPAWAGIILAALITAVVGVVAVALEN
ncbi:PH domain-containing protein [Actinacidiphila reveromycinica]|uniref:PH domain-containing protein n=1 Tax=Actinacidiphila reveromycinica TaxID=659352 RepID=UPI0019225E08|nr:PH domain-containing protein [Streptomyces sp. SN-593]